MSTTRKLNCENDRQKTGGGNENAGCITTFRMSPARRLIATIYTSLRQSVVLRAITIIIIIIRLVRFRLN